MMKSWNVEMLIAAQYFNLRFDGFGDFILQNPNVIYLTSNNLMTCFQKRFGDSISQNLNVII